QEVFNQRFQGYVALSKPQPVSVPDTQRLLADDEALVVFDFGVRSHAWVITRDGADWTNLDVSAPLLDAAVKALRDPLTNDPISASDLKPFDTQLAYKIYLATFGRLTAQLAGRTRLSVVTNGAFTSLPLQLLVTQDPANKPLKDVRWLVQ